MKKVIYLFLLLMSYSCCHIPMMVINNKTNDDIQFLFDSKDSTVYVYPVREGMLTSTGSMRKRIMYWKNLK